MINLTSSGHYTEVGLNLIYRNYLINTWSRHLTHLHSGKATNTSQLIIWWPVGLIWNKLIRSWYERRNKYQEHEEEKPRTRDIHYFLDFDLSILGSNHVEYTLYAKKIREEYSHVEEEEYCKRRAQVKSYLTHFTWSLIKLSVVLLFATPDLKWCWRKIVSISRMGVGLSEAKSIFLPYKIPTDFPTGHGKVPETKVCVLYSRVPPVCWGECPKERAERSWNVERSRWTSQHVQVETTHVWKGRDRGQESCEGQI